MHLVGNIPEDSLKQIINDFINKIPASPLSEIKEINTESQISLINLRRKLLDEKNIQEANILTLKNSLTDLKALPIENERKKDDLIFNKLELARVQSSRENGLSRSKVKIANLKLVEKKQKDYLNILESKQIIDNKIKDISTKKHNILNHKLIQDLEKENINYKEFMSRYLETQKYSEDLLLVQKIKAMEDDLTNLGNQIENQQTVKKNSGQRRDSLKNEIQNLLQLLKEIEVERNSHKTDRINQIVYEVQQYLLNNRSLKNCIVCGSDYDIPELLHGNILQQINISEKIQSTIDQKYIKYSSELRVYEEKQANNEKELTEIAKTLETLQSNYYNTAAKIENEKISILNMKLYNLSKEFLNIEIENAYKFLNTYRLTYSLTVTLDDGNNEYNLLQKDILNHINNLDNIRKELGKYSKYLDEENKKIKSKIQLMKNYDLKATQFVIKLDQQINQIEKEIQQIEYNNNIRQNKVQQVKKLLPSFNGDLTILDHTINYYENNINNLMELDHALQQILQQVKVFLSHEELIEYQKRERLLRKDIIKYEDNNKLFTQLINEIEDSKRSHTVVQSNLMTTYLLGYSEIIDKLFMQISPHAIYKHVHLVARDGNLFIIMSDKSAKEENLSDLSNEELEARFNASLTFSSGQASVLAVCIFLALNQGQNWTTLDFLGIDDPFQNMDDVNAFSFIDVLSQLSLEKQLFISTHSKEFTALMRAKIGVLDNQIGYINFQSYSDRNIKLNTNCS